MRLTVEQCLEAIDRHTRGLAEAAGGNLDRRIEHCPDWSMADLVWHLTSVHWFWNRIATERPTEEPEYADRPARPGDDALVSGLLAGMVTLVATLRAADQDAPCWTWGSTQDVAFITGHQVQEAAVHHWDAANAAGADWAMDPVAAMDSVEEFLTESVASPRWPMADAEPIGGTIWFSPSLADLAECPVWHIHDGEAPGTVAFDVHEGPAPEISGPADGDHVDPATLLLWLYRRVPDAAIDSVGRAGEPRPMLNRLRALTFTD